MSISKTELTFRTGRFKVNLNRTVYADKFINKCRSDHQIKASGTPPYIPGINESLKAPVRFSLFYQLMDIFLN